jgi:hypothetical protein
MAGPHFPSISNSIIGAGLVKLVVLMNHSKACVVLCPPFVSPRKSKEDVPKYWPVWYVKACG